MRNAARTRTAALGPVITWRRASPSEGLVPGAGGVAADARELALHGLGGHGGCFTLGGFVGEIGHGAAGVEVDRGVVGIRLGRGRHGAHAVAGAQLVVHVGELRVLGEQRHDLAVDARGAGQALALLEEVGLAREVADQAAGLGDQQRTRGHVPGVEAGLEEAVGEAGGHVGQVERGGAGAAQAGHAGHHVRHDGQVLLEVVAGAERKAGGHQALAQLGALGDADAPVVHVGAAALGGGEEVVAARVVDDRLLDLAAHRQRDGHAVDREAVDEIGGAVERIDDPDVVGIFAPCSVPDSSARMPCPGYAPSSVSMMTFSLA
jgi:hypothetical protein